MSQYTPLDMSNLKKMYGGGKTINIVFVILLLITVAVFGLVVLILLKKYQYI